MESVDLNKFTIHRPKDSSDPGFRIIGAQWRWISGRVRELSPTSNLWIPLRKSALPKKLLEHIETFNPNAFAQGDTYRRGSGELILAYAPVGQVRKHRVELDMLSNEQSNRTKLGIKNEKSDTSKDFTKLEEYEESEGSIPDEFLKKK